MDIWFEQNPSLQQCLRTKTFACLCRFRKAPQSSGHLTFQFLSNSLWCVFSAALTLWLASMPFVPVPFALFLASGLCLRLGWKWLAWQLFSPFIVKKDSLATPFPQSHAWSFSHFHTPDSSIDGLYCIPQHSVWKWNRWGVHPEESTRETQRQPGNLIYIQLQSWGILFGPGNYWWASPSPERRELMENELNKVSLRCEHWEKKWSLRVQNT